MKKILLSFIVCSIAVLVRAQDIEKPDSINGHKVILDEQSKLLPWGGTPDMAYDQFLRRRWDFVKNRAPMSPGPAPRDQYPQYYFYCAYKKNNMEPDLWMNDIGERVPNWVESARLFYAYSGDTSVMPIVKKLVDYTLDHGISPADFAWPNFPYTTANAGDTLFRGFTDNKSFQLHEIQVDHAGDMGFAFYRMYQFTGDKKYLKAAVDVANTLASKVKEGNGDASVWPYRVNMKTGDVIAPYGANWMGAYALFEALNAATPSPKYKKVMEIVQRFMIKYPMRTGFWADGHTDTDVRTNTYKSNMGENNTALYIIDHPEFDPAWKKSIPEMIAWTEKYFVFRTKQGEPATQWGANIVGEQDTFLVKMDYQTARYSAICARWYAVSGDTTYRDKAFRSLNWVTYCSDSIGRASESPVSPGITNWWSDCYGEGPRMFYHTLASIPEWTPANENHILYSKAIVKSVDYGNNAIRYTVVDPGTEILHVAFMPKKISVNGTALAASKKTTGNGYVLNKLAEKSYQLIVSHTKPGSVVVQ